MPRSTQPSAPIARTVAEFDGAVVRLAGVRRASEITTAVGRRRYLHAGPPPVDASDLPGPMRGALLGALVFEGDAHTVEEAASIVDAGDVELTPCHEAGGVGAMAGIVTPGMPVVVAETETGSTAFSPVNEGLGRALRFGSNDRATLERLVWLRDAAAPLFNRAIARAGEIVLTEIQAEGLRRGDECHNRNVASTAALLLRLVPHLIRASRKSEDAPAMIEWASENPHFFLAFSMAAAKAIADRGHRVAGSPIVTAMCGNGDRFGIRVSGLGDVWLSAPAPLGEPVLFPGYAIEDAQPMMGDSYVTETVGLGAFAISASPAIASFVGGDPAKGEAQVAEMRRICEGESSRYLLPIEDFRGSPTAINVDLVATTGTTPLVNNGLAHREPGIGQVGAGLARLPLEPFLEASEQLAGRASV